MYLTWYVCDIYSVVYRASCSTFCSSPQDAWDGYRANRQRVLDHIQENRISNTVRCDFISAFNTRLLINGKVILSGDSHANWASDLAREHLICILSYLIFLRSLS